MWPSSSHPCWGVAELSSHRQALPGLGPEPRGTLPFKSNGFLYTLTPGGGHKQVSQTYEVVVSCPHQGAHARTFSRVLLQNLSGSNIGLMMANIDLSFQFINSSLAHEAGLISAVIF